MFTSNVQNVNFNFEFPSNLKINILFSQMSIFIKETWGGLIKDFVWINFHLNNFISICEFVAFTLRIFLQRLSCIENENNFEYGGCSWEELIILNNTLTLIWFSSVKRKIFSEMNWSDQRVSNPDDWPLNQVDTKTLEMKKYLQTDTSSSWWY